MSVSRISDGSPFSNSDDKLVGRRSPPLFSRVCIVYCADNPRHRSIVCRACALQIEVDFAFQRTQLTCPLCRTKGQVANLKEDLAIGASSCCEESSCCYRLRAAEVSAVADLGAAADRHVAARHAVDKARDDAAAADEAVEAARNALETVKAST